MVYIFKNKLFLNKQHVLLQASMLQKVCQQEMNILNKDCKNIETVTAVK